MEATGGEYGRRVRAEGTGGGYGVEITIRWRAWLQLQCGRDGHRNRRLDLCRSGAPAQRPLFRQPHHGNSWIVDARRAAEVVAVHGYPLLVAHDNVVGKLPLQVLQQWKPFRIDSLQLTHTL